MKNIMLSITTAFAVLSALPTALSAQSNDMAERDKIRSEFVSGVTCLYHVSPATVKFEYLAGGVLNAKVRTIERTGSWSIQNDEFCISNPVNGARSCDKLSRAHLRTQAITLRNLEGEGRAQCRK